MKKCNPCTLWLLPILSQYDILAAQPVQEFLSCFEKRGAILAPSINPDCNTSCVFESCFLPFRSVHLPDTPFDTLSKSIRLGLNQDSGEILKVL